MDVEGDHYIVELNIDEDSLPATSQEMLHERRVAIFDLLEENEFKPLESKSGPYVVNLSLQDSSRLVFDVNRSNGSDRGSFSLNIKPFRRVIKDYFMICESYHNAIRTATSAQIEAIDMGRRGLHNEGSRMLTDSLRNHAEIEFKTSRRLFTLICSLHRRT
ncbi:MAG: UPF0262 family protein [Hellea sp.]|nr:UPF0262 family protein [Hellea sp.]